MDLDKNQYQYENEYHEEMCHIYSYYKNENLYYNFLLKS